jgi:hypothetical protein
MSAPPADFPALSASTSSSGYTDGLGRRTLAFDREDGTMLDRLSVRAELSAFERSLRERLDRLGAIDDERIARPRTIERGADGALIVLSEFVPGTRLSDLIDATAEKGGVPGVDVAFGFLLDILPALCGLHAGAGFAHGAVSAGRTVLTPAGQVVVLDPIFGEALARLHYSRRRLWTEFAIAMPPGPGTARFDAASDVAQAVLSAVMLMLGRPIREYEYPHEIPSLLVEVVEVAQIRGTTEFAAALQRFLQRSLPLPGRRPYTTADDALIEARDLARVLGLDVCRRALHEFIEHDSGGQASTTRNLHQESHEYASPFEVAEEPFTEFDVEEIADPFEVDLDLDTPAAPDDTVYELSPADDSAEETHEEPQAEPIIANVVVDAEEEIASADLSAIREFERTIDEKLGTTSISGSESPFEETDEAAATVEADADVDEFPELPDAPDDAETDSMSFDIDVPAEPPPAPGYPESKRSRRRKSARSARSRKDKLRSIARPQPAEPPPAKTPPEAAVVPPAPAPPAPLAKASPSGWLVEPGRAASFEPPVPDPVPSFAPSSLSPQPIGIVAPLSAPAPMPPPAPPTFAPTTPPQPFVPIPAPLAVAPPPPPAVVSAAPPPIVAPIASTVPPQPIAVQRVPTAAPSAPAPAVPLKLKSDSPAGYTPPRRPRMDPVEDLYSTRPEVSTESEPSRFPWKIASAAIVLLVVAVVGGRWFLQSRAEEKPRAAEAAPAPIAAPAVAPKMGRIQVTTQPPGARVVLNGKLVGDSPLNLDVAAGRHTLTLASASGSVRKTVRVEAGKTVTIDVPIFSGWVDVNAPIILDVSEEGKSLGTTEQNRLLLAPGRHVLTFSNRDLDYTLVRTVDVEPGEVKTLTIEPRGVANFNALPWAEVWVNGKKIGETPLANLELPLGTHDVVFKHPQFGERRMTTTLRANAPVALSVDMSKP